MSGCWVQWRVWASVLLGNVCLAIAAQDLDSSNGFYEDSSLICGDELMVYHVETMADSNTSLRLSVLDVRGVLAPLVTNSSCGVSVIPEDEGIDLYVEYDGCHTENKDGYYMITLFIELNMAGDWEMYQKEVLRCPILVMDAPTLGQCSGIPTAGRLQCGSPSDSQEVCIKNGCCYDQTSFGTSCFFGNEVTAQCTTDGQLTVAVSKDVTVPSLILTSVRVLGGSGPECKPVAQNDVFLLYSFPLSACGTTYKEDGASVIYENDLVGDQDVRTWRDASISRDSTFRLHIRCSFMSSGSVPVNVEVFTLPPPSPAINDGPITLEMRIAKDSLYSQYYAAEDYPILKFLRDPIYVKVHILNRNDPNLVLMLEQCWATTTPSPYQTPQWPILVDGCPFAADYSNIQLVDVDSAVQYPLHYKHFIVNTFTFVDSVSQMVLSELVYFHCSASVCVLSTADSCRTTCRVMRRKRAVNNMQAETLVSAEGPIQIYVDTQENLMEGTHRSGHLSEMGWILAVVPGSLCAVILLVVILIKRQKRIKSRIKI